LLRHLEICGGNVEQAFSSEGIEEMNKNIVALNNGKQHQPIYKVRTYEKADNKFAVGQTGNKSTKFVEAADSTNLFFAVYKMDDKRIYCTVALSDMIKIQKSCRTKGEWIAELGNYLKTEDKIPNRAIFLFLLSPNDMVYVPSSSEISNKQINYPLDKSRIFAVNDFSGNTIYFRPQSHAKALDDKEVDMRYDYNKNKIVGSYTDKTANFDGMQIKEICIPIKVDRLGNIIKKL
jgi:CRISPR-associated endonuclease Csn1